VMIHELVLELSCGQA